MNSNILNSMGLGNIDPAIFLIGMAAITICCIILTIIFIVKENNLKKTYDRFMRGADAKSLESDIAELYRDNKIFKEAAEKNRKDINLLFRKVEKSYQKLGIVKYDAYQQMGGLMSFSLAMLDEDDNGFIINSIHSTEGCYTYTKEIKEGKCKTELGKEEKEALDKAMEG